MFFGTCMYLLLGAFQEITRKSLTYYRGLKQRKTLNMILLSISPLEYTPEPLMASTFSEMAYRGWKHAPAISGATKGMALKSLSDVVIHEEVQ